MYIHSLKIYPHLLKFDINMILIYSLYTNHINSLLIKGS